MRAISHERGTETMNVVHHEIEIETSACLEFIDITDRVAELVRGSLIRHGWVNVQSRHTTVGVVVNESEPLLLQDMRRALERVAPKDMAYDHNDFSIRTVNLIPDEEPNGHSHCKALFLPVSATINLVGGGLHLGRWQRLFVVELDRPKARRISVMVMGARD